MPRTGIGPQIILLRAPLPDCPVQCPTGVFSHRTQKRRSQPSPLLLLTLGGILEKILSPWNSIWTRWTKIPLRCSWAWNNGESSRFFLPWGEGREGNTWVKRGMPILLKRTSASTRWESVLKGHIYEHLRGGQYLPPPPPLPFHDYGTDRLTKAKTAKLFIGSPSK